MTRLEPMSEADFTAFNRINIQLLAESFGAGLPHKEAVKKAEAEQKSLLPEGVKTQEQYLFSIKHEGAAGRIYADDNTTGGLWFTKLNRSGAEFAFLFFIHIDPELRGNGIGTKAMKLLEREVLKLGLGQIRLHVLKNNNKALKIYKKLGYVLFTDYENYNPDDPGIIMHKLLST